MIIVDPAIEPYFIKNEKSNYNLYKKHTPKAPVKPYEKFVSTHTDIEGALKKVVELKVEGKGGTVSLVGYLTEIRGLKLELRRITHDDLDARLAHLQKQVNELKTLFGTLPKSIPQLNMLD